MARSTSPVPEAPPLALPASTPSSRSNQTGPKAPNVAYDLGTDTGTVTVHGILRNRLAASGTIALGALTGGSGTSLEGSETATMTTTTYNIGQLSTNTTFQGSIIDNVVGVGVTAINKLGTGTLILTNPANAYTGGTTVSSGALVETVAGNTPFGVGNIAVNAGQLALTPTGSGSAVTITGAFRGRRDFHDNHRLRIHLCRRRNALPQPRNTEQLDFPGR